MNPAAPFPPAVNMTLDGLVAELNYWRALLPTMKEDDADRAALISKARHRVHLIHEELDRRLHIMRHGGSP